MRAQIELARLTGEPFNLVVSSRTQSISVPLLEQIESVTRQFGGGVFRYDPKSGQMIAFVKSK